MHQRYGWAFDTEMPYLLVQVNLEEGPSFVSTLVGVDRRGPALRHAREVTWVERNEQRIDPGVHPGVAGWKQAARPTTT